MLDRAVDEVLEQCVDLDPTRGEQHAAAQSDGRSVWIEPVAAHVTSDAVLAQEEHDPHLGARRPDSTSPHRRPRSTATGSTCCRPTPPRRSPATTGWW